MQEINKAVGQRVRSVREAQKLSREKLAERADISAQFLADIEGGKKGMTVATLYRLCLALGASADYLVFGLPEQPPNESSAMENASAPLSSDSLLLSLPPDKRQKLHSIMVLIAETIQP